MKKEMELLAPGGDIDAIKAAIVAGANAIYCGLDRFNARNRAKNILISDLCGLIRLARKNGCRLFLTLNVIIVESEIPALIALLNKLVNTRIDGLIVQDFGMFYLLSRYFPNLSIHASTQLTTHNRGQIEFLNKLQVSRVNLSRELSLPEIESLTETAHKNKLLTEVFVHGSNCLSFSGICYLSSVHSGNSGNRGRCSQPCRDKYETTAAGKDFPLNIKDNSAFFDLKELAAAGVDSLKIEGRIKKSHYVYSVVKSWREELQRFYDYHNLSTENDALHRVFNRGFSNGFLRGNIAQEMFADSPRDHSATHLAEIKGGVTTKNVEAAKKELYDLKTDIIAEVRSKIEPLRSRREALQILVSGAIDSPLEVVLRTSDREFVVMSEVNLVKNRNFETGSKKNNGASLDVELLSKRFEKINETEFFVESLNIESLSPGLFLPFKELASIKKKILYILNGSKDFVAAIDVPQIKGQKKELIRPTLSLLLSSEDELPLCGKCSGDLFFQLPDSLGEESSFFGDLFIRERRLIPWFSSVIIGDDYEAAVEFLQRVQPARVVTNNSGIAYECYKRGIDWIAGPYLNSVNSFSLLCLQETFNCRGAFISNEIKRGQLKALKRSGDFQLYYSIYHPILLMTSRQCLLHQVTGCLKDRIDENCIQRCEKSAAIVNLKKTSLLVKKTKGNHHTLYGSEHYLNTDIVADIPDLFSSFLIDVRRIETETRVAGSTAELVELFEGLLVGRSGAAEELKESIYPATNVQYTRGL